MLEIRQETKEDYKKIYNVIKTAFASAEHRDGNEQDLVNDLRKGENFIPELSLVATIEDEIVGHILFTKIKIGDSEELTLAPLAVLPEYQKQGIGGKLIIEGHKIVKKLGYHYCVVLGSENYYPRFGYVPTIKYGIKAPFEVQSKNFMAIKLNSDEKKIEGIVEYAKEFKI